MAHRVTKHGNSSRLTDSVARSPRSLQTSPPTNWSVLLEAYESVVSAMRSGHDYSLEELQGAVEYLLDAVIAARRAGPTRGIPRQSRTRLLPL